MTELIFLLNHIRVGRFGADELYLGGAGAFVREGVAGGDDFPVARPESEPAAPRLVAVDFEARVRHDGYVVDREVGEIGSGGTAADASRSFRAPGEGFVDLPGGDGAPLSVSSVNLKPVATGLILNVPMTFSFRCFCIPYYKTTGRFCQVPKTQNLRKQISVSLAVFRRRCSFF